MRQRPLRAGLVVTVLVGAGCVPASPDADTYDDKAAVTLGSAVSEARTVQRILETLVDERMLRPTAVAQMRHSEDGLGTAAKAFTELNPPRPRDRLSARVDTLLGDAEDLLDEARTAVERGEVARYTAVADELGKLVADLEKVEGRVR